ncbi:S-adenosyl-L-methionine-dependent methyltransferase [Calycina marina]|uniref:S-adenosyl-L-methionine-dependent methyltransferase n=1 Tax=Calycina marina TaxID=1763456 RepID=A0A9P7YY74_9HELO|nr:S-adenosyl-L-methionine-dependent methyltransferase [Calycina marina]
MGPDEAVLDGGDTYSIDESITAYRIENGRRYHAYRDGVYWAPNDDRQNEELEVAHNKFRILLDGRLHLAPIAHDIERVLDVGTGTGIWAIEMADEYPKAAVLGIDLSPTQPSLVPPNCSFEIDDARDCWTFPRDHFDFIHIRNLYGSISDWPALLEQVYNHLKPGGWFEHIEFGIDLKSDDDSIPPDSCLLHFVKLLKEAGDQIGQPWDISNNMLRNIEEAGFVNVVDHVYQDPVGPWAADPKLEELGRWSLLEFEIGLEGFALAMLTRVLKWSTAEVQVFLAHIRAELDDRSIHSYHDIRIVYCQKPL